MRHSNAATAAANASARHYRLRQTKEAVTCVIAEYKQPYATSRRFASWRLPRLLVLTVIVWNADDHRRRGRIPAHVCTLNTDRVGAAVSGTQSPRLQCQRQGAGNIDAGVRPCSRSFTICDV